MLTRSSAASFKLYGRKLHREYAECMRDLCERDPDLEPPFKKNVYAATTFNLGGKVATFTHTDHLNYAPGWCAVVALGDFDPKLGGHLVLWDLNIFVEFPPGSLILLPSAILRHSNARIQEGENRYSFTQYTAGGLFRWRACGFQSQKDFFAKGGKYTLDGMTRWSEAIEKFTTLDELLVDRDRAE